MESFFVNDNDKTRLNAVSLFKILLERVKSLKTKKETVPLYGFFLKKMLDVVVTKQASFVINIILENVFINGRF